VDWVDSVDTVVSCLDTVSITVEGWVDWVDTVVSWLDTVVDWVDGMPKMVDWLEAVGDLALVTVTSLVTHHGGMLVPVGLHMVMVGQRGDDGGGHHEARRELSHDGAGAWLVAVLG